MKSASEATLSDKAVHSAICQANLGMCGRGAGSTGGFSSLLAPRAVWDRQHRQHATGPSSLRHV